MREKIKDVILGYWFVALGSCYRLLLRVGILSPDPDPFVLPWDK